MLKNERQEIRNIAMILYLRTLGAGDTIQNRIVRKSTIVGYLDAVAEMFTDQKMQDPRIDPKTGKIHRLIDTILKEIERWESMPNRREPVTKTMVRHLQGTSKDHHEDSLDTAITDWMIVGLHTGYRRIEWAQEREPKTESDFQRAENPEKSIYAVTDKDIRFRDKNNKVRHDYMSVNPNKMGGIDLRWRFQKNGENGQWLTFAANHAEKDMCIVRAYLRILRRARRWNLPTGTPLAIYQKCPGSKKHSYIVTSSITRVFTRVGQEVYDYGPDDKVSYTPHSLRVGACVLLHVAKYSPLKIKQRLRWKSDSFMMYLRNVPQLAIDQIRAMNATTVDTFVLDE
jgi:hypothetical protein